MKKAMIVYPMYKAWWPCDVMERRLRDIKKKLHLRGYKVAYTLMLDMAKSLCGPDNQGLREMGKALQKMSRCDLVYFCRWQSAIGCKTVHQAALEYNKIMMFEEDEHE